MNLKSLPEYFIRVTSTELIYLSNHAVFINNAKMLISSTEHNDYLGKLAVGKIETGSIKLNQTVYVKNYFDEAKSYAGKAVNIFNFEGLKREAIEVGTAGDIVCIAGIPDITIGDTISETAEMDPIPFVKIFPNKFIF